MTVRTLYRIKYRICEPVRVLAGERIVEQPLDVYIKTLRKNHPDAQSIYMELLEEYEEDDESATSIESVIIMGYKEGGYGIVGLNLPEQAKYKFPTVAFK